VASLVVAGDRLVLKLSRLERLLGLAVRNPDAPLTAVRIVYAVRPAQSAIRGIRAPGAGIPSLLALGHWRGNGHHDFVAVYGKHAGVVVELDPREAFDRWIVSLDDPDAVVAEILKGGLSRPSEN
jgi:hypothetical protein